MGRIAFYDKICLVLSLAIPISVSGILFLLFITQQHVHRNLASWINDNRASTQIVVQVLSLLLGTLHIYTFSTLARFWTCIRLTRKPISLDSIKLLHAMTGNKLDLEISLRKKLLLIFYLATIKIPSALWTGSLTPVSRTKATTASYTIPDYSISTQPLWGQKCEPIRECRQSLPKKSSQLGTFTYVVWKGMIVQRSLIEVVAKCVL